MEIQQCKVSPRFPLESRLSQSLNRFHSPEWDEKGAIRAGNVDFTLHCCISITDKVKINDLQKSIVAGLLYVHIDFEVICPAGSYLDFEPVGVLCLVTSARSKGKPPKSIFIERSGVARSVRNRKLIA